MLKKSKLLHSMGVVVRNRHNPEFYNKVIVGVDKFNEFTVTSYGTQNYGSAIYDINIVGKNSGFYAIFRSILHGLYFADMCGFKPFISITRSSYNDDENNVFSEFFYQPSSLTEEEVNQSICVIPYTTEHRRWAEKEFVHNGDVAGYDFDEKLIDRLAEISNKYITYREEIKNELEDNVKKLFDNKQRVVGVHIRGNAYNVGFAGHPIALQPEDYFQAVENCIADGFDAVFVATDELDILSSFKERFGDKVIYYDDVIRSNDGIDVHNNSKRFNVSGRQLAFEVIRDVFTLAHCEALICGKSQVSFAARIEKKSYGKEFCPLEIIDKGVYKENNKDRLREYEKKAKLIS